MVFIYNSLLTKIIFNFNHLLVFRQFSGMYYNAYNLLFNLKSQIILHKLILSLFVIFNLQAFVDILGVDFLGFKKSIFFFEFFLPKLSKDFRYALFYLFRSIKGFFLFSINLKFFNHFFIFSLVYLFEGSSWSERECFDMFGFFFLRNMGLRRILTDYGFKGYPLLKDFPLIGFLELSYNNELNIVVYDYVFLIQNYRNFTFNVKNWERFFFNTYKFNFIQFL